MENIWKLCSCHSGSHQLRKSREFLMLLVSSWTPSVRCKKSPVSSWKTGIPMSFPAAHWHQVPLHFWPCSPSHPQCHQQHPHNHFLVNATVPYGNIYLTDDCVLTAQAKKCKPNCVKKLLFLHFSSPAKQCISCLAPTGKEYHVTQSLPFLPFHHLKTVSIPQHMFNMAASALEHTKVWGLKSSLVHPEIVLIFLLVFTYRRLLSRINLWQYFKQCKWY